MTIQVLIFTAIPVIREGLISIFEGVTDISVAGIAQSGAEAIAKTVSLHPDVVLLDSYMTEITSYKLIKKVCRFDKNTRCLVFGALCDRQSVYESLSAGAHGWILNTEKPARIREAIRTVANGREWVSPQVSGKLLRDMGNSSVWNSLLTERETDVLQFIARGCSNVRIAAGLGITKGTVKNHLLSIYKKLEVESRSEAIAKVWEQGWVTSESKHDLLPYENMQKGIHEI